MNKQKGLKTMAIEAKDYESKFQDRIEKAETRMQIEITARKTAEKEIERLNKSITYKDGQLNTIGLMGKKITRSEKEFASLKIQNSQLIETSKNLSELLKLCVTNGKK